MTVVDTTPPVITVTSPGTTTVEAGGSWTEPGATANDNIDGSVAVTVGGATVNPGAAVGTMFTVTYDAVDVAGIAFGLLTIGLLAIGVRRACRRA